MLSAVKKNENENDVRFGNLITDEELAELLKGFILKNTSNSTSWALRNFNLRYGKKLEAADRLEKEGEGFHLTSCSEETKLLNSQLSRYVLETRN